MSTLKKQKQNWYTFSGSIVTVDATLSGIVKYDMLAKNQIMLTVSQLDNDQNEPV